MNKDKISIIIPVYNTEKYLKRCLDSIINQTYKEIEIIIINDGSTDNSFKIIKSYEKMDSRIIIINKKNKGCVSALNDGIKIASGEFIGFIDSDDYIDSRMYEILYKAIKKIMLIYLSVVFYQILYIQIKMKY